MLKRGARERGARAMAKGMEGAGGQQE